MTVVIDEVVPVFLHRITVSIVIETAIHFYAIKMYQSYLVVPCHFFFPKCKHFPNIPINFISVADIVLKWALNTEHWTSMFRNLTVVICSIFYDFHSIDILISFFIITFFSFLSIFALRLSLLIWFLVELSEWYYIECFTHFRISLSWASHWIGSRNMKL